MKNKSGIKSAIKMMVKTLNQMGVTLTGFETDKELPTYFVEIDGKRTIQDLDSTLTSVYGILWILTYGQVNDENRNLKIDLQYNLINKEEMVQ